MKGWKQTKGQNNQVPRDITLWTQTPEYWERKDNDTLDYIWSVDNAPIGFSLRQQAAQAIRPDSGARLQPKPPPTPLGTGRDREFKPYNRGNRWKGKGRKSLSPRKSAEAIEFRRKFLETR